MSGGKSIRKLVQLIETRITSEVVKKLGVSNTVLLCALKSGIYNRDEKKKES
jgi:hypothetical protein